MELKDTVNLMLSDDFKDRLKAEYIQTKIRLDKLTKYIKKLGKFPESEYEVSIFSQWWVLNQYKEILYKRLKLLGIDITEV